METTYIIQAVRMIVKHFIISNGTMCLLLIQSKQPLHQDAIGNKNLYMEKSIIM